MLGGDEVDVSRFDVDAPDSERCAAADEPLYAYAFEPLRQLAQRMPPRNRPPTRRLLQQLLDPQLEVLVDPIEIRCVGWKPSHELVVRGRISEAGKHSRKGGVRRADDEERAGLRHPQLCLDRRHPTFLRGGRRVGCPLAGAGSRG